jgi:hypothetical protein
MKACVGALISTCPIRRHSLRVTQRYADYPVLPQSRPDVALRNGSRSLSHGQQYLSLSLMDSDKRAASAFVLTVGIEAANHR